MLKVILSGGGTAGHVNPALAISEIIKEIYHPTRSSCTSGRRTGIEKDLVAKAGLDFAPMNVAGFQRRLSLRNIKRNMTAAWYLMTSGSRSRQIISSFKRIL